MCTKNGHIARLGMVSGVVVFINNVMYILLTDFVDMLNESKRIEVPADVYEQKENMLEMMKNGVEQTEK